MKNSILQSKQNVKPKKLRIIHIKLIVMVAFVLLCLASASAVPTFTGKQNKHNGCAGKQGKHHGCGHKHRKHPGEQEMIEVDIEFSNPFGTTVTDSTGSLYYNISGDLIFADSTVYPDEYHGTYPLYMPGTEVDIDVYITNLEPRSIAKLALMTEAYMMNPDGSSGIPQMDPITQVLEVAPGETKMIDATFMLPSDGKTPPGLNRFIANVYDYDDASLILTEEGIFCPPDKSLTDFYRAEPTVNPVPVPGAFMLGSMGMGIVGWMRRRRSL